MEGPFNFFFVDIFFFFFLTLSLSSFWTSRGHRCRPFFPPVLASIFIAHRVQQSHCSSIFHRVKIANSRSRAFRKSICSQEKVPTNALGEARTHETDLYQARGQPDTYATGATCKLPWCADKRPTESFPDIQNRRVSGPKKNKIKRSFHTFFGELLLNHVSKFQVLTPKIERCMAKFPPRSASEYKFTCIAGIHP